MNHLFTKLNQRKKEVVRLSLQSLITRFSAILVTDFLKLSLIHSLKYD